MKILYISQFYYPERVAAAFRSYENSRLWNKEIDVTVFTAYPNFPTGKIFEGYSNKLLSVEYVNEIKTLRSKIIVKENTSKIKRGISSLSFMFFGIVNILFNKKKIGKDYEVVLGTSGTIFAPIIAYLFSLINKIPFVLELRDITYVQILAAYSGKQSLIYKIIKCLELFLCRKAVKVVVVTKGFKKQLIKDGIKYEKIEVIPNGAIINKKNSLHETIIPAYDNKNFILTYIGNLGVSQNLKDVVIFFNNLDIKYRKKKLILIGDGAKKYELKNFISDNDISNVLILDGMPPEKLETYYNTSDFCIVSLKDNKFFKDTIPSKIFQIMTRKKSILYFGPDGEGASIIKQANCGVVYDGKDFIKNAMDFSIKINKLILNKEYNNRLIESGTSGYEYVDKYYNREKLSNNYLKLLYKVENLWRKRDESTY